MVEYSNSLRLRYEQPPSRALSYARQNQMKKTCPLMRQNRLRSLIESVHAEKLHSNRAAAIIVEAGDNQGQGQVAARLVRFFDPPLVLQYSLALGLTHT